MPCLVAVRAGNLLPHTAIWALGSGQQPVNLSTAKGLAGSETGLPVVLVSTRDKQVARHILLTATCAQHRFLASLMHSCSRPFTVLSASCMGKDPVSCCPILLADNRLGNCTVKSDSVQASSLMGSKDSTEMETDLLRNKTEISSLCGLSPQGLGKDAQPMEVEQRQNLWV